MVWFVIALGLSILIGAVGARAQHLQSQRGWSVLSPYAGGAQRTFTPLERWDDERVREVAQRHREAVMRQRGTA